MTKLLAAGILCLGAPFLSFGQCPAGDPLQILNNTSWAYSIHTPSGGVGAIGTFKAALVAGQPTVNGLQTVNNNGQIARQESFSGRYTIDPDCRGGEILINVNRSAVQLQFYFAANFTKMEFVNDGSDYYLSTQVLSARALALRLAGVVFTGSARKNPPAGCPAGLPNPLNVLTNTWTFRTYNFGFPIVIPVRQFPVPTFAIADTAVAGTFDPTVQLTGFGPTGVISVTETINREGTIFQNGSIDRGVKALGRFLINPDCSGGEIMIMTARQPVQYEFVFADAAFGTMYLLSDSDALLLIGAAEKF